MKNALELIVERKTTGIYDPDVVISDSDVKEIANYAFQSPYVVGERGEGVLDDADPVTAGGELVVDPAPSGAVSEGAVHEHHVTHGPGCGVRRRLRVGHGAEGESRGSGGEDGTK